MKKIFVLMLACLMLFSFTLTSSAATFSDVAENAWYYTFVNDLSNKKVINGYPDGTFNPDGKVTVAEFIKLIIVASTPNMYYELVDKDFDHWAATYVKVGENTGVFEEGEYTMEDMDKEIKRIEIVKILSRCDMLIKETPQASSDKRFTDVSDISADDMFYLSHAVGIGVISGDPVGTFRPNDGLTRAECAKVIYTYTNR